MSNLDILNKTFRSTLGLDGNTDLATVAYGQIDEWDSLAHMQLVAAIEVAFDIMMETDEVIAMSSFTAAQQLLVENHGISFDA